MLTSAGLPAPAAQVKVGACDEAEEDIIEALSAAGDCVLVHKIGEPGGSNMVQRVMHGRAAVGGRGGWAAALRTLVSAAGACTGEPLGLLR